MSNECACSAAQTDCQPKAAEAPRYETCNKHVMRVVHLQDRAYADGKSFANRIPYVDEAHATRQGTTLHLPSEATHVRDGSATVLPLATETLQEQPKISGQLPLVRQP